MRRWILAVGLASLALATAALAGDPWKDKKAAEWTQNDVQKILTDSPWTRQYSVMSTDAQPAAGPRGNDTGGFGNEGMAITGGGESSGRRSGRSEESTTTERQVLYTAQWYSSRTIRAAQARAAELTGTPVAADNPLLKVPPSYQVVLRSAELSRFAKVGEDGLKKSSYLELKKTHQRIAPTRIVIVQGRGRPAAVVYEFAKTTAGGEPIVAGDEKSIEFVSAGDQITVKFRFDMNKMVDPQGADL
jgi:hypothetical protein